MQTALLAVSGHLFHLFGPNNGVFEARVTKGQTEVDWLNAPSTRELGEKIDRWIDKHTDLALRWPGVVLHRQEFGAHDTTTVATVGAFFDWFEEFEPDMAPDLNPGYLAGLCQNGTLQRCFAVTSLDGGRLLWPVDTADSLMDLYQQDTPESHRRRPDSSALAELRADDIVLARAKLTDLADTPIAPAPAGAMSLEEKYARLLTVARNLASVQPEAPDLDIEDADFNPYDQFGGNMDDAFHGGYETGCQEADHQTHQALKEVLDAIGEPLNPAA